MASPSTGLVGHLNVAFELTSMFQHRVTSGSINGPEAITNLAYIMSNSTVARPPVTSQVDSMYCPVCRHLLLVIYSCMNPRPAPAVQTQRLISVFFSCSSVDLFSSVKCIPENTKVVCYLAFKANLKS